MSPPASLGVTDKIAFVIEGAFSEAECKALIAASEAAGYEPALLNVGRGRQALETDVRKSQRCMRDDEELAERMWERVAPFVPRALRGYPAVGLNERLRFLRYEQGDYFIGHMDGTYVRPRNHPTRPLDRSRLTYLLYLNEDFEGGELVMTTSLEGREISIKPRTGMVVVHNHDIYHEAKCVTSKGSVRYCIRTDIMFAAKREPATIDKLASKREPATIDKLASTREPATIDKLASTLAAGLVGKRGTPEG